MNDPQPDGPDRRRRPLDRRPARPSRPCRPRAACQPLWLIVNPWREDWWVGLVVGFTADGKPIVVVPTALGDFDARNATFEYPAAVADEAFLAALGDEVVYYRGLDPYLQVPL